MYTLVLVLAKVLFGKKFNLDASTAFSMINSAKHTVPLQYLLFTKK